MCLPQCALESIAIYPLDTIINRRNSIVSVLSAACGTGVWAAPSQRTPWQRPPVKPLLRLPNLEGGYWQLSAHLGQVVLLNFWASWCGPCRAEMPALEYLLTSRADAGLRVVAVNYREATPTVQAFVTQTNWHIPVVIDADGAAAKDLRVHIFPTTLVIDRRGRGRFAVVGEYDWRGPEAGQWIDELLAE